MMSWQQLVPLIAAAGHSRLFATRQVFGSQASSETPNATYQEQMKTTVGYIWLAAGAPMSRGVMEWKLPAVAVPLFLQHLRRRCLGAE